MTFTNGKHQYNGNLNDRSKRSRSKIVKGLKKVANQKTFDMLKWEKICENYLPMPNHFSNHICDNCKNFKCYRK